MILTRKTRRGMTLVELMVAAAMCILGMWLLTWLYQQGLESFRLARSQAELTTQERMVTTILTRDLKADHFVDEDNKPNRGRRLSDQTAGWFDPNGYTPPRGGYFWARSTPVGFGNNIPEVDYFQASDGFSSSRSTDHFLQFTVILPGGSNHDVFSAEIPAYSSQMWYSTAAEVSYSLVYSGTTPGGVPLHNLVRRQRIIARSDDDAPAYALPSSMPDAPEVMSVVGGQMRTLRDATVPIGYTSLTNLPSTRMTPYSPLGVLSPRYGEDLLMANIISFEVKFTGNAAPGSGIVWPTPFPVNSDYPYDNLPFNGEFDTFSTNLNNWNQDANIARTSNTTGVLKPLRITGAQIRLRAYEPRTRSTRQTTIIVDL